MIFFSYFPENQHLQRQKKINIDTIIIIIYHKYGYKKGANK